MQLPEVEFDEKKFLARVDQLVKQHGFCSIVVSEGCHYPDGRFLAEQGQTRLQNDQTGHHSGYLISIVNGLPVAVHPLASALREAGFHPGPTGMHLRRSAKPPTSPVNGLVPGRLSPQEAAKNRPALTRPD